MNKTIVRAGYEGFFKKNVMSVNINVQDMCNFNCSYCINSASKSRMNRMLDKKILGDFIDDIKIRNNEEYLFAIAGGEPLLYPHIEFLVKKINDSLKCKTIYFATNGSLLYKKGENLYSAAKSTKLKFSISIHIEQIAINEFIKNIIEFGHHEDIKCKILYAPGELDKSKEIISLLQMHNISYIISVVTNPGGIPYSYSEEELKFLDQDETSKCIEFTHEYEDSTIEGFDRITRGLHPEKFNYQGLFCCAGFNALRLAPDNTVARCFGFLRQGERFNLTKRRLRDIHEFAKPCICPSSYCGCLNFLRTPKWSNHKYSPEYIIF